jgi:hypothetical protein
MMATVTKAFVYFYKKEINYEGTNKYPNLSQAFLKIKLAKKTIFYNHPLYIYCILLNITCLES